MILRTSLSLSPSVWLPRSHSCSLCSMLFISPLRALIGVILGDSNYPHIVLRSRIVTQFVCISQHKCDLMWNRENVYLITAKNKQKKHWIYTLKETEVVIFLKILCHLFTLLGKHLQWYSFQSILYIICIIFNCECSSVCFANWYYCGLLSLSTNPIKRLKLTVFSVTKKKRFSSKGPRINLQALKCLVPHLKPLTSVVLFQLQRSK